MSLASDQVFVGVSAWDVAYDLTPDVGSVCCVYCQCEGNHTSYGRGEAVLTNPGLAYDMNNDANYVCMNHLGAERRTIYDPHENVWRTWLGRYY